MYLRQRQEGYAVRARVYLGRDGVAFHDCGELGTVATPAEAVDRWGNVEWQPDGVQIGSGTNRIFVSRAELEKAQKSPSP